MKSSKNLPLRFLLYIANQYSEITRSANLYGSKIVKIPTPEFIIFYNGKKDCPDRQILRISDMYTVKMDSYKLELEATIVYRRKCPKRVSGKTQNGGKSNEYI